MLSILLILIMPLISMGGARMLDMPGQSFVGPLPALSVDQLRLRDALREHVKVLSADIGDRELTFRYRQLTAAADYIERALNRIGYADVKSQAYTVRGKRVRNIFVEVAGKTEPDEILVIGAHYDSVPGCSAANDNGSGVAATLELARGFVSRKPNHTIRFVFFVNEEPPYFQTEQMGSLVYARACREQNENIVGMISVETIGYFSDAPGSQQYPMPIAHAYPDRGNFIGFAGDIGAADFIKRVVGSFRKHGKIPSEGAALPDSLPGIGWSDHWSFTKMGFPALMVTDTAPFRYPHYHTPHDTIDKLDFDRMTRVVDGSAAVVADLAG